MKNMVKKNQIMITALAIMIAVAGYLNFAGDKISKEDIMTVSSGSVEQNTGNTTEDSLPVAEMFEISEEDMGQSTYSDINSLESDVQITEDFMKESMDGNVTASSTENMEETSASVDTPLTSSGAGVLSDARLMKEQTRAKNKETLLEVINNVNISEEQKQEAVNNIISITNVAEKETAAEILLEAKGFKGAVVSITDTTVDVVVNIGELTESQRAQIEDIVIRKTGVSAEAIIISTIANQ